MTHAGARARLSRYVDGDLAGRERARLARHLESCAACRAEADALRRTVSLLRELPEPPAPPPGWAEGALERLRAERSRRGALARAAAALAGTRAAPAFAGAAGLALALGLAALDPAAFGGGERPAPEARAPSQAPLAARALRAPPVAPRRERLAARAPERPPQAAEASAPEAAAASGEEAPGLRECLRAGPGAGSTGAGSCARWHAWMARLALVDPPAFVAQIESLPAPERERWLRELAAFAFRSGSAQVLAKELRKTPDPRASSLAAHFERTRAGR